VRATLGFEEERLQLEKIEESLKLGKRVWSFGMKS